MPNYNRVEHPVLNVSIGGGAAAKRPSYFSLITDEGLPSVLAALRFPAESGIGAAGDPVTVRMALGTEEFLLFTGKVYSAGDHGAYRELALTDGYQKLCDTNVVGAYRKEAAKAILQDALDSAGVGGTDITCPAVEIARFSTKKIPAEYYIRLLIKALEEHGHFGLRFFFDEQDIFHFGTDKDSGKHAGPVFELASGKNILRKGEGFIEALPLPIRHTQAAAVDGVTLIPRRTDLTVSGTHSRLVLWLRTAGGPREAA